jgi:hypothetical protein
MKRLRQLGDALLIEGIPHIGAIHPDRRNMVLLDDYRIVSVEPMPDLNLIPASH